MRSYGRLTQAERYQICALVRSGSNITTIGRILSRHPSTICRELKRNRDVRKRYIGFHAHSFAKKRRRHIHPPIKLEGKLKKIVTSKLLEQWSPEQISGRLRQQKLFISHETIYQHIYRDFKSGGSVFLNLRRRRKHRRTQKAGRGFKRCGKRLSYPSISLRPKEVEKRKRLGDYERDTVLGKFMGPVLLSIVDRTSRLTKIGKINRSNADLAHKKTIDLLKKLPVRTITNDNGPEFAGYNQTEKSLKTKVFFSDPYSSWQRGTNENTNGLIRQYYPKGTDFRKVSDEEIKRLETLLNNRPRKCLGYRTPHEVQRSKLGVLH